MPTIIMIAVVASFALTAAIGGSLRSGSVDPHELTLKARDLPAQKIDQLY